MDFGVVTAPKDSRSRPPIPLPKTQAIKSLVRGGIMHPLLVVAVPLVLITLGMILNSIGLSFDQPSSSPEQDPAKRLAAERETFRQFFDRQRTRAIQRQKRVGQYAWLLMFATIGSFIWLYTDTVSKTTLSNRIASLQSLASQEGKDLVLSVTHSDGNNVKYLVKLPQGNKNPDAASTATAAKETVSSWELERLGTALSIGDNSLPLGVALKISN
ncbi:MAG TPA: hypothetical protein VIM04_03320 [Candidatus Binatia bacterium]|jgi:hypothetical protein